VTAWSAQLFRDGEPVTGAVPCDAWDAAGLLGPVVVGWLGGPVSVTRAVLDHVAEETRRELNQIEFA
jgi:hypothetical protein